MNYSYIIIDDNQESVLKTKAIADSFSELTFMASAQNYREGLNLILEHNPQLIFLEIDPENKESNLSLALINELHRYLFTIPKIIITTTKNDLAFDAMQYEVNDYFIKPIQRIDIIKSILKMKKVIGDEAVFKSKNHTPNKPEKKLEEEYGDFEEEEKVDQFEEIIDQEEEEVYQEEEIENQDEEIVDQDEEREFSEVSTQTTFLQKGTARNEQPLVLCIKSYGDYRYIDAKDICYLQADNNSTDIHLNNGEMVTAFKTLKHFEGILTYPFVRIHNSYILNRDYISRIHTGNTVCYIKNTTTKIPFSKSYKENVDLIISDFANGNYLEI